MARKFDKDKWELPEFFNLVKKELEAKERSSIILSHTFDQYQDHAISPLLVKGDTEYKRVCVFRNKENHISHTCLKVSDPKTRFSILSRRKICFKCFKGGHLTVNCLKCKVCKCRKCSAKHNISISSRQAIPDATPVEELQKANTTIIKKVSFMTTH